MIAIPDNPPPDDSPTIAELAVDKSSGYFCVQLRDGTMIKFEQLERIGNMLRLFNPEVTGPIAAWCNSLHVAEILESDVLIWGFLRSRKA